MDMSNFLQEQGSLHFTTFITSHIYHIRFISTAFPGLPAGFSCQYRWQQVLKVFGKSNTKLIQF